VKGLGVDLDVEWRHFSLQQNNSTEVDQPPVWRESDLASTRSGLAALAAEAAKKLGAEYFDRFFLLLLKERHAGSRVPLNDVGTFVEIARQSGLNVEDFQEAMLDSSLVEKIEEDHLEASEVHGIFGTPTFVFENGHTAFVKTFIPPVDESVDAFNEFMNLFGSKSYIGEIKRPQPPWPKGAV
jgi:hypothetical protein